MRELRKSKKMTMKEFGERFNLAESTISGYENGTRKPDIDQVRKFADFFEVTTDYILGQTVVNYPETLKEDKSFYMSRIATEFPDIDLMFKDLESLDAEGMKEVYDYIKFKVSQNKK
ncbi:helix-turn-helix transcriptional regulator [Sporosarcina sp. FSL K6-2383]|uniref:helix-turn-helix domain-containing protein n=1 Tax=Sporosarcina sp. FSL K6-2383 TaxID=2921556 RepID=UPI003159B193